ncbi:MAG: hypothetical protein ACP5NP_05340 [Acetobacteraceae bacterium]
MIGRRGLAGGLTAALLAGRARAQAPPPFATHKLVLQLSDASRDKQLLIISTANAMLKAYPDQIAIDVVAFGPGVELLYRHAPERVAVDSLVAQGVRFDVCMNTINTLARETGHAPELNPHAHKVPFGVQRILQLVGKGYVLVRP